MIVPCETRKRPNTSCHDSSRSSTGPTSLLIHASQLIAAAAASAAVCRSLVFLGCDADKLPPHCNRSLRTEFSSVGCLPYVTYKMVGVSRGTVVLMISPSSSKFGSTFSLLTSHNRSLITRCCSREQTHYDAKSHLPTRCVCTALQRLRNYNISEEFF